MSRIPMRVSAISLLIVYHPLNFVDPNGDSIHIHRLHKDDESSPRRDLGDNMGLLLNN